MLAVTSFVRALLGACFLGMLAPRAALAEVERFALIAGNNRGDSNEQVLHYAEADAARVRDVLREVGGFEPANILLLQGEDATTLRTSLISLNSRIRQRVSTPGVQVMFVVYYSGHADAADLHLRGTRLPLRELEELVRGSPATFRIAVLDGCRSGALTRSKGGKLVAPFALTAQKVLPSEGLAFLTASTADEDAQESDELRGSFFTHALLSGLLGAADANADGDIVLDEAYRYAYAATLRSTSRTWGGPQHPTFRYDFRGRGDLVLTQPGLQDAERAHLQLPEAMSTLLMRDNAHGQVVAEVTEHATSRTLSLRPGRYFVRARGRDALHEGAIEVSAGTSTAVRVQDLEAIEYARLVRKGGTQRTLAHAFELGGQGMLPLSNAETPCAGGFAGYSFDTAELGARARLSLCSARTEGELLDARLMAYGLSVRLYRAWDVGPMTFELGLGPGLSWLHQSFSTRGRAPDRSALVPHLAIGGGIAFDVGGGVYVAMDVAAETHVLVLDDSAADGRRTEVDFTARGALLTGIRL